MTLQLEITYNEHDEPCLLLPDDLLDRLNWKEGDELMFDFIDDQLFLTKIKHNEPTDQK